MNKDAVNVQHDQAEQDGLNDGSGVDGDREKQQGQGVARRGGGCGDGRTGFEIGDRVQVYWDGEDTWFCGVVEDIAADQVRVRYEDDDEVHWEDCTAVHPAAPQACSCCVWRRQAGRQTGKRTDGRTDRQDACTKVF